MSEIDDILAKIPMDQLAAHLGTDPQTAETATREALPALLGGLHANAQDPAGAASLQQALSQHDPSLVDGGVDLGSVDTTKGAAIVSNIFGDKQNQVTTALGGLGGKGDGLVSKLLPMLAPIVMSWLVGRVTKGVQGGGSGGQASSSGGLGGILGSVLGAGGGGGGGSQGGQGGQPSITNILGGLLGGGKR